MNRSLSAAVLATIPASLRSNVAAEPRLVRLVRRAAERSTLRTQARQVARAERDAAVVAQARDGIWLERSRLQGGSRTSPVQSDYELLRRIR